MQNTANLIEKVGSDYLMTPGMGAHKLHLRKLAWNRARKVCLQEGGEFSGRFVPHVVDRHSPLRACQASAKT